MDRPEYLYYRGCAKLKLAHIYRHWLNFLYDSIILYSFDYYADYSNVRWVFFPQSDNVDTKHVFLIFFL